MSGKPPVYDRTALRLTEAQKKAYKEQNIMPHYRFLLNDEEVKWLDLVRGESSIHMSSLSDPVLLRADGRVIYKELEHSGNVYFVKRPDGASEGYNRYGGTNLDVDRICNYTNDSTTAVDGYEKYGIL